MERDLRIYAKGMAFSDGVYDLRTLEKLISCHRKILDRLISVQLGRRQVTSKLKNQLNYDVRINSGSIEFLVTFLLEHKEFIPAVYQTDAGVRLSEIVVQLLRDAIKLREKTSEARVQGWLPTINIVNSFNFGKQIENTNVAFDNNGQIFIKDPKVLTAAQLTRAPVNELLAQVDGKTVEYINMNSASENFRFTPEQKDIIGAQKEELPTTLKIIGRLDMVAFTSHKGCIVSDGDRYHVTWDEHIRQKVQQIADIEGVVFKVRPVVDHMRLDNEPIGFHVLNCENPQLKLDV